MHFTSENLRITDFLASDISNSYLSWLNDKEYMKYSNQRHLIHTRESAIKYLESFNEGCDHFLGIFDEVVNLVGTITIYIDQFNKHANIGLLISPQNNGKGIGKKSFQVVLNELPKHLELRKIISGTCELNKPMLKILENSGMTLDYIVPQEYFYEGKFFDNIMYAKYL